MKAASATQGDVAPRMRFERGPREGAERDPLITVVTELERQGGSGRPATQIVFASDSRTHAGMDNFASFSKMTVFERAGDRVVALRS
jgi:hypothetical protein